MKIWRRRASNTMQTARAKKMRRRKKAIAKGLTLMLREEKWAILETEVETKGEEIEDK